MTIPHAHRARRCFARLTRPALFSLALLVGIDIAGCANPAAPTTASVAVLTAPPLPLDIGNEESALDFLTPEAVRAYRRMAQDLAQSLRDSYRRGEAPQPGEAAQMSMCLQFLGHSTQEVEALNQYELDHYPDSEMLVEILRGAPDRARIQALIPPD